VRKWSGSTPPTAPVQVGVAAHEAVLLQNLATSMLGMLEERESSSPADELEEIRACAPVTRSLRRMNDEAATAGFLSIADGPSRRFGTTESLNSALRSLHEPEIIDAKRQAAQRLLETVPDAAASSNQRGRRARLGRGVNDVRLALGHNARCRPQRARPVAADHPWSDTSMYTMADGAAGVSRAGPHGQAVMKAITDVGGIRVGQRHRLDPDVTLGAGWARAPPSC